MLRAQQFKQEIERRKKIANRIQAFVDTGWSLEAATELAEISIE